MAETLNTAIEPVFDPQSVGPSLDAVQAQLPIRSAWMRGTIIGEIASRRRGDGYERDGLRDYEYGDDPRHIDWPATARATTGMPVVRERYADITPSLWIVTDMLDKRHQQNPGYFSEQILALSAITALMRIAYVNGLPTAVLATDGRKLAVEQRVPVSGRSHTLSMAQRLARAIPEVAPRQRGVGLSERSEVHLSDMLQRAASRCTESMVAVVSDFRDVAAADDAEHGWQRPLQQLAHNRNELLAVELTNPDDVVLPERVSRLTSISDVSWVGTGRRERAARKKYTAAAAAQQAEIVDNLARVRAHHVRLDTTEPRWLTSMREQLHSRP